MIDVEAALESVENTLDEVLENLNTLEDLYTGKIQERISRAWNDISEAHSEITGYIAKVFPFTLLGLEEISTYIYSHPSVRGQRRASSGLSALAELRLKAMDSRQS